MASFPTVVDEHSRLVTQLNERCIRQVLADLIRDVDELGAVGDDGVVEVW